MSESPLVSVALITYNNAEFLTDCIESILGQTYKNLEIIIADDGSSDNSRAIIEKYASLSEKIVPVISSKNMGISYNLNLAISKCTGEYICIIAGDDQMYPDKIRKQVEFLEVNPDYGICLHNVDVYDESLKRVTHNWLEKYLPPRKAEDALFRTNWYNFYDPIRRTPSGSWFGRKSYISMGRNDIRTSGYHEFIFVLGMHNSNPNLKWHTLPEVLGLYRVHEKGLSKQKNSWISEAEEMTIAFELARIKFPEFGMMIGDELKFWWYKSFLYSRIPEDTKSSYLKDFLNKYGFFNLIRLRIYQILLSDRLKIVRRLFKVIRG